MKRNNLHTKLVSYINSKDYTADRYTDAIFSVSTTDSKVTSVRAEFASVERQEEYHEGTTSAKDTKYSEVKINDVTLTTSQKVEKDVYDYTGNNMTGWVGWNKYKTVNLYVNGVLINTANLFPTAHNSSASDTEKTVDGKTYVIYVDAETETVDNAEEGCPDGWFENRPDIRCFNYEVDPQTGCSRATGCRSGNRECGPKGYLTSNGITCYTATAPEPEPEVCRCKLTVDFEQGGGSPMGDTKVDFLVSLSGETCKSNRDDLIVEFPDIGWSGSNCNYVKNHNFLTLSQMRVGIEDRYTITTGTGDACHFLGVNEPGHKTYIVKINGQQISPTGSSAFAATDGSKCYLSHDLSYGDRSH